MGDENTRCWSDARHLLRRTGSAGDAKALDPAQSDMTRGEAVDNLLDFKPSRFNPGGKVIDQVHNSWVKYMIRTRVPLQEKLVLFWHDHFATSYATVAR